MADVLPYTCGTRSPRLLGVRNYLNNYFAMCKRLTHSRIRVELAAPRLVGVSNYLNKYFARCTCLTRCPIQADLASNTYLGLGII